VQVDDEGDPKVLKSTDKWRLEPSKWVLAWDGYASAVAALKQACVPLCQPSLIGRACSCAFVQLTFGSATVHRRIGMEITVNGSAEGRRPLLGMLYDEVARKECEDKAAKIGDNFDVNSSLLL
jgi:hypothetical protein